MSLSGGCQCGAVRFSVEPASLGDAGLCHCRMCQKAFSSPYAVLVTVRSGGLRWTRGEPGYFQSSANVRRGFCGRCGTPLTYEPAGTDIELATIAFDDPSAVVPSHQSSQSTHIPWTDNIAAIPWRVAGFESAGIVSFQHPDHDTPNG